MRAKFISRDGLSLETSIPDYPPQMMIRRPLQSKFDHCVAQDIAVTIEYQCETRQYAFTGYDCDIAIYKEQ